LPRVAATLGWRAAIALSGAVVALAVSFIWRPLGGLDRGAPAVAPTLAAAPSDWSWARRPSSPSSRAG